MYCLTQLYLMLYIYNLLHNDQLHFSAFTMAIFRLRLKTLSKQLYQINVTAVTLVTIFYIRLHTVYFKLSVVYVHIIL